MRVGKATDQGILSSDHWQGRVSQVLQKDETILHYVEAVEPPPIGAIVKATLDWNRRYLDMRLHSAGHIVDFALNLLGYSPSPLMPFKGEHEKKPVIYYQRTVGKDFREELEKKANELVALDLLFSFRFADHKALEQDAIYLQPGLPKIQALKAFNSSRSWKRG